MASSSKSQSASRSRSRSRQRDDRGRSPRIHPNTIEEENNGGGSDSFFSATQSDFLNYHDSRSRSRTPTGRGYGATEGTSPLRISRGSVAEPQSPYGSQIRRRAAPVHQLATSLPSQGHFFPHAHNEATATVVPRESDHLADWETLARLMEPVATSSGEPSSRITSGSGSPRRPHSISHRPSIRRDQSPISVRSVTSPVRMFGRSSATPIEDVPEDEHESESYGAASFSTSPGTLEYMSCISQFTEASDTGTIHAPQRPPQTGIEESYERFFAPATPGLSSFPTFSASGDGSPKPPAPSTSAMRRWLAWRPPAYCKPIFKCSLAYLLATMFTFVPALSALLSSRSETDVHGRVRKVPAYSAHMVATIVVYFNPSKTLGNMILSTRYCLALATMAALVCLLSFEIIKLFDHYSPPKGTEWGWISEVGDWVVCLLCVGGSMGALAWLKLWVGNASFNTGCSMAAVTLFTVIVKEGGWIKLKEVLCIVLIGVTITNVVCFTVFPVSATSRLRASMSKSLNSFSTLLDLLTSTFLLKPPLEKEHRMPLADAVKSHGAAFNSLKADLAESKHERLIDPRIRGSKLDLYDAALGSMARLAQHLAALRGSTRLEEAILLAVRDGRISLDPAEKITPTIAASVVGDLNNLPSVNVEDKEDVAQSIDLLLQLQRMTGPDLDLLVERCDDALDGIEAVLTSKSKEARQVDLQRVHSGVTEALRTFSRSSSRAIKRVYAGPRRRKGVYGSDSSSSDSSHSSGSGSDSDEDEGPNEVVFLVYFCLFTIEEFARELLFLLDTVQDITTAPRLSAMDQLNYFVRPWKRISRKRNFLYKQFQKLVPIDPHRLQPPLFPRTQRDERGTLLTPGPDGLSLRARIYQWTWTLGARLTEPDMKYAIKTGLAGAMLAAPAFIDRTRPIFLEYKGEWALVAFFATMSQSIGQTNFISVFRILGTLLGGAGAVLACTLFPENPVMLPIFGFFFSMPCFYIITQMPEYVQAGRFILLTYNLTCLYAYNLRAADVSPVAIAARRSASVIVGVLWAGIVSRYWWPYTARRELRNGLGDFCLDLSYLYSKLITTYMGGKDMTQQVSESDSSGETSPLLPTGSARHHLDPGVLQFMAMELHLQGQLSSLRGLLTHAKREPRLKGPFASDFYHDVLLSCERMLDRLHSMRCVTTRHEWDESIRQAFILPVNRYQREMAGNIILYFYTLSAGFRLRIPMPPYLPPAEPARERLVDAIRDLDVVKRRSVRAGGRHLLFFAYALAMQEVIAELDFLGSLLQDAFGVISQSTVGDFEELFVGGPEPDVSVHLAHFANDSSSHI